MSSRNRSSHRHSSANDWHCPRCKVKIFGSKSKCSKCGTPERARNDWVCPGCDGLIFASKAQCLKCEIYKPVPVFKVPPPPTPEEIAAKEQKQKEMEELLQKYKDYDANPSLCGHGNRVPYGRKLDCSGYGYGTCAYGLCTHQQCRVECYKCS